MRLEQGLGGLFIAIWLAAFGLGLAYMVAIIWAIIKVTNHFVP